MSRINEDESGSPRSSSILLVDDHPLVRERLAEIINLEPDLHVCGEAADQAQALDAISRLQPDLVVVDLTLKQSHGLELIKDIRARYPRLAVLVVSMHDEMLYAERVIRAGARGYVSKQEASKKILLAIRKTLAGEIYLSEAAAAMIAAKIAGNTPSPLSAMNRLSDRELRIFELLGQGCAIRQIADELHLDVKTVETYRARIKTKLGLKDTNEVLREAIHWVRAVS